MSKLQAWQTEGVQTAATALDCTMFLSWLLVMMRSPSGSHTAAVTSAECCLITCAQAPFAKFHIRKDPSFPGCPTCKAQCYARCRHANRQLMCGLSI